MPTRSLHWKQSRAATLTQRTRAFRKIHDDNNGLVEDNTVRVEDFELFYSDQLVDAFRRKTQQLCDETRDLYEQKLERLEAQHERQMQSLQHQLRQVVGSCVSLTEHKQILATTAAEHQRQLEGVRRLHQSEMLEVEQRCEQKWLIKVAAVRKQSEQEKATMIQRMEQIELQKTEATAEAKERELSELRLSEQLEAADRANGIGEQQADDMKKRLQDACQLIVALKTRLRRHAKLVESQRDKANEARGEVMKCKVAYAELRGDMKSRERELNQAQRAMADEKVTKCALESLVTGLREQLQRQECFAVELATESALSARHHAAEREQLQREIEVLRKALQEKKQSIEDAAARIDKMQQGAAEAQLQHQELQTRLELQQTKEGALKWKMQKLKQRVEQFKAVVEKLLAENKQLDEEVHNRDASTEAWAKKLFGGH